MTFVEEKNEIENNRSDRLEQYSASMYAEEHIMCREDLEALLSLMPNKRYALIIKLRYFEGLSNEDTAAALQMSMDNFYNKHMRAKKQFNEILKKEYGILL